MLLLLLLTSVLTFSVTESMAQVAIEVSYGVDRNVDSPQSEIDGWLNGTVEWMLPSGLGLGVGTDHQFETASISPSDHLGWAIYLSASQEFPLGITAPFVRGGFGLGRVPCVGDTCGGGAYYRGSVGMRLRLVGNMRVSGEVGISRVSRPFGGAGMSVRF